MQRTGGVDSRIDLEKLPSEVRTAYHVFASHCSRCHTIARPLNAYVRRVEHWNRYVHRMMRQPGSGINPREAKVILTFLHYYTLEIKGLKPLQDEPQASSEPTGADLIAPNPGVRPVPAAAQPSEQAPSEQHAPNPRQQAQPPHQPLDPSQQP